MALPLIVFSFLLKHSDANLESTSTDDLAVFIFLFTSQRSWFRSSSLFIKYRKRVHCFLHRPNFIFHKGKLALKLCIDYAERYPNA